MENTKLKVVKMERCFLTDGSSWFNADNAEHYQASYENGFCLSSGSTIQYESLYLTESNVFILKKFSVTMPTITKYKRITKEEALKWFYANEYLVEFVPQIMIDKKSFMSEYEALIEKTEI
jgi:hypothetical protein